MKYGVNPQLTCETSGAGRWMNGRAVYGSPSSHVTFKMHSFSHLEVRIFQVIP